MLSIPYSVSVDLKQKADMCVSCGMCLPLCPSYMLTRQEADSPRGRISLILAALNNKLEIDDSLMAHLDQCLLCRSCEKVCPAAVPFASIMDQMRDQLYPERKRLSLWKRYLLNKISNLSGLHRVAGIASSSLSKSIFKLLARLPVGRISKTSAMAVQAEKPMTWQECYPAKGESQYDVGLFLGCIHDVFNQQAINDTIYVLNQCGVTVHVPRHQQCCGALHLHNGQLDQAKAMHAYNRDSFAVHDFDAVIGVSSACTLTSREFEQEHGQNYFMPVDIFGFLESIHWQSKIDLTELPVHVALHEPCVQKNISRDMQILLDCMQRVPGLQIQRVENTLCCGAAGTFMLESPLWAEALGIKTMESLSACHVDVICSSNTGCALHLKTLKAGNNKTDVMHPVSVLAAAVSGDWKSRLIKTQIFRY